MSLEVTMPQMGESVVEGTVTKWLVREGEQVNEDQPLCEISTDKVDTEIPSPAAGVIARLIASEGQTLPVGAALAVIENAEAGAAALPKTAPTESKPALKPVQPKPDSSESSVSSGRAVRPRVEAEIAPTATAVRENDRVAAPPRRYSPVVLRMAEEHGIDLSLVPGSGLGGRVSKRDVERYLETLQTGVAVVPPANGTAVLQPVSPLAAQSTIPPAPAPAAFRPPVYQPRDGDTVEPFSRRRKLIAEHMVYSKTHSPHVGTVAELDLTRLVTLRETHKDAFQKREGFALTLLPFAAMA